VVPYGRNPAPRGSLGVSRQPKVDSAQGMPHVCNLTRHLILYKFVLKRLVLYAASGITINLT